MRRTIGVLAVTNRLRDYRLFRVNNGIVLQYWFLAQLTREKQPGSSAVGLPKKWERILKWERTATVLYVFKSELVDFEGTFGG